MPPRKLTPQTPGEPIQEADTTEQPAPEAEQPAAQAEQAPVEATETAPAADAPEPQPTTTETAASAADPDPVVARRPGELPHAAEIDPKTLKQPVLTQQGYVVPEK